MSDHQTKDKMDQMEEDQEEVYRTWPDRRKLSPARKTVEVTGSVSVQHLTSNTTNTSTQPMSMAAALESLNISYCPDNKCLQPSGEVESDENEIQNIYYKPGHRKAYSLPRTLEGVDDNGTISHPVVEHDVVVESPRSAIQRCGLQYQHWRPGPVTDPDCVSSVSEADSGVFSESQHSQEAGQVPGSARPRLGEMIRSGLAANLRLLSRSGQQVARLVRKETEAEPVSSASSQSLIMESRPAGVPAKAAGEEEKHRLEHRLLLEKIKRKEENEGRSRAARLAEHSHNYHSLKLVWEFISSLMKPTFS